MVSSPWALLWLASPVRQTSPATINSCPVSSRRRSICPPHSHIFQQGRPSRKDIGARRSRQSLSKPPDLKSSARDMLTWLEANLGLFNSSIPQSLSQAITCTHQTYFSSSQQCSHAPAIPFDMGLAWQIHPLQAGGPIVYGKDGATSQGGYSCWIGFIPSQQIGLAVLTNLFGVKGPQGEQNPTELGLDILKSLVALDEKTAY
ncbi:MAG: serine hydrolase [Roseiflexaceae bacterium]